jgi:hypothetical protein
MHIETIERTGDDNRKLSNHYDLSGLVEKLKQFEPEFRAVAEEASASRKKVSRRGGLK